VAVGHGLAVRSSRNERMTGVAICPRRVRARAGRRWTGAATFLVAMADDERERDAQDGGGHQADHPTSNRSELGPLGPEHGPEALTPRIIGRSRGWAGTRGHDCAFLSELARNSASPLVSWR